jgi:hypothetical protein
MKAWMMLVGAVGVIVVQVVLVWDYLAANRQDPFVLNPDRKLHDNSVAVLMFCGSSADSDREVLDKVPDGQLGQ